jgi:hypothetical protein
MREATSVEIENIFVDALGKFMVIKNQMEAHGGTPTPKQIEAAQKLKSNLIIQMSRIGVQIPDSVIDLNKVEPDSAFGRFIRNRLPNVLAQSGASFG